MWELIKFVFWALVCLFFFGKLVQRWDAYEASRAQPVASAPQSSDVLRITNFTKRNVPGEDESVPYVDKETDRKVDFNAGDTKRVITLDYVLHLQRGTPIAAVTRYMGADPEVVFLHSEKVWVYNWFSPGGHLGVEGYAKSGGVHCVDVWSFTEHSGDNYQLARSPDASAIWVIGTNGFYKAIKGDHPGRSY